MHYGQLENSEYTSTQDSVDTRRYDEENFENSESFARCRRVCVFACLMIHSFTYQLFLTVLSRRMDDKAGKEKASNNRGSDFHSRGDLGKAIEYHKKDLEIAIKIGDRAREGNAYGNLGNTYRLLGNFRRAIEHHEKNLRLAIEIGDRAREGEAYGNLGFAYDSMGDFPKAIECHEKYLKLAIEIGDLDGKGRASICLLYTSPSPRDGLLSRMPSSA